MNKTLYFDNQQIKNYLVGFASLFAEIPYRDRMGQLQIVPIHYGSPSDVVSFLEKNVDNEATTNRNRLKDVSIPLFSFRMTGIEKNNDKRRAPHDSFTVDLRRLGYNTGYVAMRPAPYKFTIELVCWASSDYQAFEIAEQIIPYFNSPQQVKIEPLPKCPISTTEIFLDSVEIDTDPESQKYSTLVTMTFSLTGYLLAQPKIWSTNMAFELDLLVKHWDDITTTSILRRPPIQQPNQPIIEVDYPSKSLIPENKQELLASLESFILQTPELNYEFGEYVGIFAGLVSTGRMDVHGNILNTAEVILTDEYGTDRTVTANEINIASDKITDAILIYSNAITQEYIKTLTVPGNLLAMQRMLQGKTESIGVYLKLLDNNLVTKAFNVTQNGITGSDKMRLFGTTIVDVDEHLASMRNHLAVLQNLMVFKSLLGYRGVFNSRMTAYVYSAALDASLLPQQVKDFIPNDFIENSYIQDIFTFDVSDDYELIITSPAGTQFEVLVETLEGYHICDYISDIDEFEKSSIPLNGVIQPNQPFGIIINILGGRSGIVGCIVKKTDEPVDISSYDIFGIPTTAVGYYNGLVKNSLKLDENYYKLSVVSKLLSSRFIDLDNYVVAALMYITMQNSRVDVSDLSRVVKQKYQLDTETIIEYANELLQLVWSSSLVFDLESPIKDIDLIEGRVFTPQYTDSEIRQVVARDKLNSPIFDFNRDGIIDDADLMLLNAAVDNPADYYFHLEYGVWYKMPNTATYPPEKRKYVVECLQVLVNWVEKPSHTAIFNLLKLVGKKLVTDDLVFDPQYTTEEMRRLVDVNGCDYDDVEVHLTECRTIIESLKTILITEREFVYAATYPISNSGKYMLFGIPELSIDRLFAGKYLHMYFSEFETDAIRLEKSKVLTPFLKNKLSYYMDYFVDTFDILLNDISSLVHPKII